MPNIDYEAVYKRLKQMIINREIEPGEIINQSKLSEDLGVSRTPLRQALGELQGEGIIVKSAKGWYAKEFYIKDMISVFEIRAVLEGLCCRLAAPKLTLADIAYLRTLMVNAYEEFRKGDWNAYHKADVEFHHRIIDAAEDSILGRTIDANKILITSHLIANSHIPYLSNPEEGIFILEPHRSFEDHMNIIKVLEQKEGDLAEVAMREHIRNALNNLRNRENKLQSLYMTTVL